MIGALARLRFRLSRRIGSTSVADATAYPRFCVLAARDPRTFATFKREPIYTQILEHVSCEDGARYLRRALELRPRLARELDRFRRNDELGSPATCDYDGHGRFSPTTLRYLKVLADLLDLFGSLDGMDLVEIGGGYGGQCLLLSAAAAPKSYTLVDLEGPLLLQREYLRRQGVGGTRFVRPEQLTADHTYDLVISNYAFSELVRPVQEHYLETVLRRSTRGYLTYNWLSPVDSGPPLSRGELLAALPGSRFVDPVPQLIATEELLLWGTDAPGGAGPAGL